MCVWTEPTRSGFPGITSKMQEIPSIFSSPYLDSTLEDVNHGGWDRQLLLAFTRLYCSPLGKGVNFADVGHVIFLVSTLQCLLLMVFCVVMFGQKRFTAIEKLLLKYNDFTTLVVHSTCTY